MSNIVLKDRQGTKQTYSGVEVIKIADSEGNYNNYVAEPTGEIEITANGSVDVSKYARARVAVPSDTADEWDGTGVVIAPITPEASPSITINGTTYNVVEGMTWFTWASNEEYNTDNFRCLNVDSKVFVAESEDYIIDSDGNAVYGEDLITVGGVYSIEEPTTDELAGTWVFNSDLSISSSATYDVRFNTPALDFDFVALIIGKAVGGNLQYRANTGTAYIAYQSHMWESVDFRTIIISSKLSEVTNGSALLTFLKATATKQGAANLITFTVDGTSFQAEEGMTWAEWCESDYNTDGVKIDSLGNVVTSVGLRIATAQYSGAQIQTDVIVANTSYVVQHAGGVD